MKSSLSIRALLLALVSVLAGFGIILASLRAFDAWQSFDRIRKAEEAVLLGNRLLEASFNWARERGQTLGALVAQDTSSRVMVERIRQAREAGDAAFARAEQRLSMMSGDAVREAFSSFSRERASVLTLRLRVDAVVSGRETDEEYTLTTDAPAAITRMIEAAAELRRAAWFAAGIDDQELEQIENAKHLVYIMGEFSGRERGAIGRAIIARERMTPALLVTLGNFRGRVESANGMIQTFIGLGFVPNAVREAYLMVDEVVFRRFQETRQAVYASGVQGGRYPISFDQWWDMSTEAINTILRVSEALTAAAEERLAERHEQAVQDAIIAGLVLVGSVVLLLVVAAVVTIRLFRPLSSLQGAMLAIAKGDLSVSLPPVRHQDEIGAMTAALTTCRDGLRETERLRAEQQTMQARAEEERVRERRRMAEEVDARLGAIARDLSATAEQLKSSADGLSSFAERTSSEATEAAAGVGRTGGNINSIAAAIEEMTASISEIASRVSEAASMARDADGQVKASTELVRSLTERSQRIGEVVRLINDIAGQTNLLALNATIEAARAGEAGKGFAVVASEVKNLASQTAKATEEIGEEIAMMRVAVDQVVKAIGTIASAVSRNSEIATVIAASVEEQGAVTRDISRNVADTASDADRVARSVGTVRDNARETSAIAITVRDAGGHVANQGSTLRQELDRIVSSLRAA
jgi:methyl-accepting chemotaxis protein